MDVEYTVRVSDLWRVQKHHYVRNWPGRIKFFLMSLSLTALTFVETWTAPPPYGRDSVFTGMSTVFVLLVWLLFVYALMWFTGWLRYWRTPASWRGARLRLAPDALEFTNRAGESRVRWDGIVEIDEDKRLIYFHANRRFAFLVPKRAFESVDDVAAFLRQARDYWTAATQSSFGRP